MNPPPSNSHHQDYNMFSRSLLKKPSFATVCWEKLDPIHTPESSSRVCGGWTSTPKTEGLVIPWRFGSPEGRSLNWEVSRVDRWVHPLWKWIFSWNSQILKKVKPLNKGPIQNHDLTCAFFTSKWVKSVPKNMCARVLLPLKLLDTYCGGFRIWGGSGFQIYQFQDSCSTFNHPSLYSKNIPYINHSLLSRLSF